MNIHDYRQKYLELEKNISNAQKELEIFKISAKKNFESLYAKEKEEHLIWFAEHIDYFKKHKEYIQKSALLSKIVIDFMPLYGGGGLISGAGFSLCSGYKIYLGDLLKLWESGFCYNGYPIVFCELGVHWSTHYTIRYIKDKKIEEVHEKFEGHQWYLPQIGPKIFEDMKKANINRKYENMSTFKNIELIMKNMVEKK